MRGEALVPPSPARRLHQAEGHVFRVSDFNGLRLDRYFSPL